MMNVCPLLPRPRSFRALPGVLRLDATTIVSGDFAAATAWILRRSTGLPFPEKIGTENLPGPHLRTVHDLQLGAEEYRLVVQPSGVLICAGGRRGAIWAAQSLLQLAQVPAPAPRAVKLATAPVGTEARQPATPPAAATTPATAPAPTTATAPATETVPAPPLARCGVAEELVVPCAEITDQPRYAWRGCGLDTARHFFPVADLADFLGWLSYYKINVFHWHLTDDQGWRFESRRYPRLTSVGSWRSETISPLHGTDRTPHGGFYTQAQIRYICQLAEKLGITVVPEIEFPGHLSAAIAAYPKLGATSAQDVPTAPATRPVARTWGVFEGTLRFTEENLRFVTDIWEEVLEVTGARIVHIGGDEVPPGPWKLDKPTAQFCARHGIAGPHALQAWFTNYLVSWLDERGVQAVAWDEAFENVPATQQAPNLICQAWRGHARGQKIAAADIRTIMSPAELLYFNNYQSLDSAEPYAQGALSTVADVCAYDPSAGLPAPAARNVLGTQFMVWTEYVENYRQLQYCAWPRALAFAELAWHATPVPAPAAAPVPATTSAPVATAGNAAAASAQTVTETKAAAASAANSDFRARMDAHLAVLAAAGLNYRPLAGPLPWQKAGTGRRQRPDRLDGIIM
ncbi:beta-N-acetylhexosaminidase [Actinobaculum suis]|nr:family 20 glycosylhydrolase [Actinobaculum suis]